MQIKEVMTPMPEFIEPATTIMDAAQRMQDRDIGAIPVGENDRLVGMITDRDITTRAVAGGSDPKTTAVRDVMTKGICYCYENDDIKEAAKIMEEKQIRRLVVLNKDKRMVGIVSLGDFALKDHDSNLNAEILKEVSETVH